MRKSLSAALLAVCLAVTGCASSRQSETEQAAAELGLSPEAQRCCQHPDWVDNHPLFKGAAAAVGFLELWAFFGLASLAN